MPRTCPHCGCTKAAALRRPVRAHDYIVCGGCGLVLRLDENTQPVRITDEELMGFSDDLLLSLAAAKAVVTLAWRTEEIREKARRN